MPHPQITLIQQSLFTANGLRNVAWAMEALRIIDPRTVDALIASLRGYADDLERAVRAVDADAVTQEASHALRADRDRLVGLIDAMRHEHRCPANSCKVCDERADECELQHGECQRYRSYPCNCIKSKSQVTR